MEEFWPCYEAVKVAWPERHQLKSVLCIGQHAATFGAKEVLLHMNLISVTYTSTLCLFNTLEGGVSLPQKHAGVFAAAVAAFLGRLEVSPAAFDFNVRTANILQTLEDGAVSVAPVGTMAYAACPSLTYSLTADGCLPQPDLPSGPIADTAQEAPGPSMWSGEESSPSARQRKASLRNHPYGRKQRGGAAQPAGSEGCAITEPCY